MTAFIWAKDRADRGASGWSDKSATLRRKIATVITTAILASAMAGGSVAEENASNPLASVSNIDFKAQVIKATAGENLSMIIDGATMLSPKVKLKYKLEYDVSNVTGSTEHHFDLLSVTPIYFPSRGVINEEWRYGTAIGSEFILDLGDRSKGIGPGASQVAPLAGVALSHVSGWTLVPILQHFESVGDGTDISTTSPFLLAIKPFGDANWFKVDAKFPYDWNNDSWPLTTEIQFGRNLSKSSAIYVNTLIGIGGDKPYDYGIGFGVRSNY